MKNEEIKIKNEELRMASAKPKLTEKGKNHSTLASLMVLHSTFFIGYASLKVLHLNFLLASSITSITLSHHASNSGSSC